MTDVVDEALRGSFDIHVHTAPDVHRARVMDDIDYAHSLREVGAGGAVLKNHHSLTADRAAMARKVVPGVEMFGGICLDASVGGILPFVVESALRFVPELALCKIVWMPTIHAREYGHRLYPGEPGYSALDDDGHLLPEVIEIIDLVRDAGAILATGHLPFAEALAVVSTAAARGAERLIVTHVDAPYLGFSLEQRLELSRHAYLEHCAVQTLPSNANIPIEAVVASMRLVGIDRCIVSSDLGAVGHPEPVEGMRQYLTRLLDAGLQPAEVVKMARETPRQLLGVPEMPGATALTDANAIRT